MPRSRIPLAVAAALALVSIAGLTEAAQPPQAPANSQTAQVTAAPPSAPRQAPAAKAPTTKTPATKTPAAASTSAPTAPPAAARTKVAARKCMRLPLSDIAVGRDETIAQARMRLGEYADKESKKRGWGATTKSLETVSCDVYLVLPFIGTEYKCMVTATFCTK